MQRSKSLSSSRCTVSLSIALSVLPLLATGCEQSFQRMGHEVPGPAGSIAAAPLTRGRIAVLAGDERAKGVFIIDDISGAVLRSFGVTREATDIIAATADGPLLLSIGKNADGRPVGAIEQWSLDGAKQRVVPLPGEGLEMTSVDGRTAYVLVGGTNDARAAVPIDAVSLHFGRAVALNAGSRALARCTSHSGEFLIYTDDRSGGVAVRDLHSKGTAFTRLSGDGTTCRRGSDLVYAVVGNLFARRIAVLKLPSLAEVGSMPASRNASELYTSDSTRLIALNATTGISTIETFDHSWEDMNTAFSGTSLVSR